MNIRRFALLLLSLVSLTLSAQRNNLYNQYIEKYKLMAIEQMERYKIPASITLAQGLLESGAGTSRLAVKANNHFGIKCGSTWKGKYIRHNDNLMGEKFRAYDSPRESYEDHSLFLTTRAHYAPLFKLKITDYKGWARGLKKAGYATNPQYAQKLIKIIEDYDLMQYDRMSSTNTANRQTTTSISPVATPTPVQTITVTTVANAVVQRPRPVNTSQLTIYRANNNYYVLARQGDTFATIADDLGMSARKLRRYNELSRKHTLSPGDIIYLEKKSSKADKCWKGKFHTVGSGESVYTVSQIYGVKVETIYKQNGLSSTYTPVVGDRLRIR